MADRYWVGGTASWDGSAASKWSTTSGGGGGAAEPTSSDNVFFDGNSGAVTVSVDGIVACLNLDCTGFTGTMAFPGFSVITPYGDIKFVAGMSVTTNIDAGIWPQGSGTRILTTGGKTLPSFQFDGGGSWTLQDNLVSDGDWLIASGVTFNANNLNVTVQSCSNAGAVTMGSGTWTITGLGGVFTAGAWNSVSGTVTANTSTLKFTNSSNSDLIFSGGGKTYNIVWFARGASTGTNDIRGANTFNELKDDGTVAHIVKLPVSTTQTITTWNIDGQSCSVQTSVQSATSGTPATISSPSGTKTGNYLIAKDITATGGGHLEL